MNINLSKLDLQKLQRLIFVKESNIASANMFLYYLSTFARGINNLTILERMSNDHINEEKAFFLELLNLLDIDKSDKRNKEYIDSYIKGNVKLLNKDDYVENPYYKDIKAKETSLKNWKLEYHHYLPFEGFSSEDIYVYEDNFYLEKTYIGFFKEEFEFLTICQNDIVWMSLTPNEIETMKDSIALVKGKVVCFGLGLGYFAYMASLKEEVSSVTIVENDENVITLFKECILPQFKNKEKIYLVKSDAFNYANNMAGEQFDYAFVDLWHNPEDGILSYIKMKKLERFSDKTKFLYWLETSLIALLRRELIILIEEQLEGYKESDYLKAENENDTIINELYRISKDESFSLFSEIVSYLSSENIKSIVYQINFDTKMID